MSKTELKMPQERDVLPRYMRSFSPCSGWVGRAVHESEQILPIINDGIKVAERRVVVEIPAGEAMSAYKPEQFKIGNLLEAGVPLTEVNFMLNSRNQNEQLVNKAIELGIYDESLSIFRPQAIVSDNNVEPEKPAEQ